jgi:8-oxo-dGTP pyrophosphatase MutT (NUDIX family)
MASKPIKYNIRVYGVMLNLQNEVLVLNEEYRGIKMKKFPGGGHQLGESLKDCLAREFWEELNVQVHVGKHLYTTDFLQLSAFNDKEQLLSIYYHVELSEKDDLRIVHQKMEMITWVPLSAIASYDFTFPIDKKVGELLPGLLGL